MINADILNAQIVDRAFLHYDNKFDARTITALSNTGLFSDIQPSPLPDNIEEIISNKEHPQKLTPFIGPYLVVKNNEKQLSVYEWKDFIVHPNKSLCSIAINVLHTMSTEHKELFTEFTKGLLAKHYENIEADEPHLSTEILLSLYDAVSNDFLFNLSGITQAAKLNFQKGYETCLLSALQPSYATLETLAPSVLSTLQGNNKAESGLRTLANESKNIAAVLDEYLKNYGVIPFSNQHSAYSFLKERLKVEDNEEKTFRELLNWANTSHSPLADYHFCQLIISCPTLLPKNSQKDFWARALTILSASSSKEEPKGRDAQWKLLSLLSKYYCFYLESRLPSYDGELLAASSWWFANKLVASLAEAKLVGVVLQSESLLSLKEQVRYLWSLSKSPIKPSTLRYATLYSESLWSHSLLGELGDRILQLVSDGLDEKEQKIVTDSICRTLVTIPYSETEDDKRYRFSFQNSPIAVSNAWKELLGSEKVGKTIDVLSSGTKELEKSNQTESNFLKFGKLEEHQQLLTLSHLHHRILCLNEENNFVWEAIQSAEWYQDALLNSEKHVLTTLFETLFELQLLSSNEWRVNLPHFFATTYYFLRDNQKKESAKLALTYVILSSLASNTTSAVGRLIRAHPDTVIKEELANWHLRINELIKVVPIWLASRFRPLLALLSYETTDILNQKK